MNKTAIGRVVEVDVESPWMTDEELQKHYKKNTKRKIQEVARAMQNHPTASRWVRTGEVRTCHIEAYDEFYSWYQRYKNVPRKPELIFTKKFNAWKRAKGDENE